MGTVGTTGPTTDLQASGVGGGGRSACRDQPCLGVARGGHDLDGGSVLGIGTGKLDPPSGQSASEKRPVGNESGPMVQNNVSWPDAGKALQKAPKRPLILSPAPVLSRKREITINGGFVGAADLRARCDLGISGPGRDHAVAVVAAVAVAGFSDCLGFVLWCSWELLGWPKRFGTLTVDLSYKLVTPFFASRLAWLQNKTDTAGVWYA